MKPKIIEFKCPSPFFELIRDDKKPFLIRLDPKDTRFRALAQWRYNHASWKRIWAIRLVHPSGEFICRELRNIDYLRTKIGLPIIDWLILYLGNDIPPKPERKQEHEQ